MDVVIDVEAKADVDAKMKKQAKMKVECGSMHTLVR